MVLKAFKDFQAWAERQSGHKIKQIRTDRGTEYMDEMIAYVKSIGIEYCPTAAYSPQSNGVAERMNRTLFDMACPMLDASGAGFRSRQYFLHSMNIVGVEDQHQLLYCQSRQLTT